MPPEIPDIAQPYKQIVQEISKLKNIYPYSSNNEAYNSALDMCIKLILLIERENKTKTKPNENY